MVTLFIQTLTKEATDVIRDSNHKTRQERTNLTFDDIMKLLEYLLETIYFGFSDAIYQWRCSVAMECPVSGIVVVYINDKRRYQGHGHYPQSANPGFVGGMLKTA